MASSRSAQCRTAVSRSCEDDATRLRPSPSTLDGVSDTSSTAASEPAAGTELTAEEKSEQYDNFDEVSAAI